MSRNRWQRGAVDLVSVAAGTVIMAIVTAGTASALVFGRETMMREEHYKTAAYILRGKMEEISAQLQLVADARSMQNRGALVYPRVQLDQANDRGGVEVIWAEIYRDQIIEVNDPTTGDSPDHYLVTVHARWNERDYAENRRGGLGQRREITLKTAVACRALL